MSNNCWIIDTGATCHICPFYGCLKTIRDLGKEISIHMPDGNTKTTTKCGDVSLNGSLVLENVLYVLTFKFNLLSVGKIVKSGDLGCHFYVGFCSFQDHRTDKVVALGRLKGSLYILDSKSLKLDNRLHFNGFSNDLLFSANCSDVENSIWHSRFGHPSRIVSKHVYPLKDKVLDGLVCNFCPMSKQTRLPFNDSVNVSSECFDLLHADIWGPYKQSSLFGASYFLTLVDDQQ